MIKLRLYLPAIVLAAWAVVLVFLSPGHLVLAFAWLSIAVAFKVQIDEARRQHRWNQDHRDDGDRR